LVGYCVQKSLILKIYKYQSIPVTAHGIKTLSIKDIDKASIVIAIIEVRMNIKISFISSDWELKLRKEAKIPINVPTNTANDPSTDLGANI
jgi:hypothetical protein